MILIRRRACPFKLNTLLVLLSLWLASGAFAEKTPRVLIIANALKEPYSQSIDGFKQQLSGHFKIDYTEIGIAESKLDDNALTQLISSNPPDLIFSLGEHASALAAKQSGVPVVSTLVLKIENFKNANLTGVNLMYPFSTQIEWLKKLLPDKTQVAVLFNSAENSKVIAIIKKLTERAGLVLHAIPVESAKQLPDALEQLSRDVDMVLAIPDEITMSPKTAKEVLLASFRNKLPFVGLSDNWVKSGAFYALSWDYEDLGKQCASQAQKMLDGTAPDKITIEAPRKIAYSINTKIAEHLNIQIPYNLAVNAKTAYQ